MVSIRAQSFVAFVTFLNAVQCDRDWWRTTNIYEIYVRSFKDSNGDGIGDLRGITSKIQYLVDLGVETVWLTPFFKSPMFDMGYDVQSFTEVDPIYGTMHDFEQLMKKMKSVGLKLMLDIVPNHCSEEHEWFQMSIKRIDPYTDYFIWKDPLGFDANQKPIPPNNWLSVFSTCAWTFNKERGQFYLHQFAAEQPDLNLRNPLVRKEIMDVMRFWVKKGVNAFRLDATKYLIEDKEFRNETYIDLRYEGDMRYTHMEHNYTTDLWESYELIHEWRSNIEQEFNQDAQRDPIIFVAEAYCETNNTMMYYGREDYQITNFPFNFQLLTHERQPSAYYFAWAITSWVNNMPNKNSVANWVVENHDHPRISDRHCAEFIDILNIMILALPGVPCLYYGQELGMMNAKVRPDQRQDPYNDGIDPTSTRDGERSPMQWDDSINAGFTTTSKPWLPVNPNYWHLNVQKQKQSNASHYSIVKKLMQIKKTNTVQYGDLKTYVLSNWTFAFTRSLKNHETYIAVFNFGSETEIVDLSAKIEDLPIYANVVISSLNAGHNEGELISTTLLFPNLLTMRPTSAFILTTINDNDAKIIMDPKNQSSVSSSLCSATSTWLHSLIGFVLYFILKLLSS